MTTSTPHRHTKKRLMKTVGAHTPCSCGYIQGGDLYFYIKDYQGNVRVALNQANRPVEVNSYYQFETGELSYDFFTGDAGYLYDMTDEVKAFNIQSVVENGIRYQVFDLKQNRIPEHVTYEEQVKAASKNRSNNIYRRKVNGKKITVKPNGY